MSYSPFSSRKLSRRRSLGWLGAGLAGVAQSQAFASATADFPARSVRLIVPFAPGGTTDVLARLVAARMSTDLGQTVYVDNLPGAAGNIGTATAARAAGNGYTMVVASVSNFAINTALYPSLAYKPMQDFKLVGTMARFPNIVVVKASAPYQTMDQWIAFAKAHPGKLSYGSGGAGTTQHLVPEALARALQLDLLHVPYKGVGPALMALMAGEVDVLFDNSLSVMPHIRAGKLRPLAVTTGQRIAALPDLPTLSEKALPGFDFVGWQGLAVPTATPQPVVQRLNKALQVALADAVVQQRLKDLEAEPAPGSSEDFNRLLQTDTPRWAGLVRSLQLSAE